MKKSKMFLMVSCVAVSVVCSGCLSRAVKEGMGAAQGGQGVYQQIDKKVANFNDYSYEVGDFEIVYPSITPGPFENQLKFELKKQLSEKGAIIGKVPGKKLITIHGRIFYYEVAGSSGEIFGPLEEVAGDVLLTNEDGKNIALAVCAGRTTATVARGSKHKAEGMANAITKWIVKNTPDLQEKKEKKE